MPYREIIAVCSQIHTKHINTVCGQKLELLNVKVYREIIAVCSQIHTKHINTLCGKNVEFVNVKPGGIYSNHWALDG